MGVRLGTQGVPPEYNRERADQQYSQNDGASRHAKTSRHIRLLEKSLGKAFSTEKATALERWPCKEYDCACLARPFKIPAALTLSAAPAD